MEITKKMLDEALAILRDEPARPSFWVLGPNAAKWLVEQFEKHDD